MNEQSAESGSNRREINLDEYPERVGCYIIPTYDEAVTDVEVTDAEDRKIRATVPIEATMSLRVGAIYYALPEDKREFLEGELTAGMVRCRIIDSIPITGLLRIELPSVTGYDEFFIPKERLVRKV